MSRRAPTGLSAPPNAYLLFLDHHSALLVKRICKDIYLPRITGMQIVHVLEAIELIVNQVHSSLSIFIFSLSSLRLISRNSDYLVFR